PCGVCDGRNAGSESVVAISIFDATAIVGLSRVVSRLRSARRNLAAAYVGADWPRRGADSRFDAPRRNRHETGLLRRTPRGDESLSTGVSNVGQMDSPSWCHWHHLRLGGSASPT